ncbi:MAG: hypothetical protein AAF715_31225 [Myxococcota bacterium]
MTAVALASSVLAMGCGAEVDVDPGGGEEPPRPGDQGSEPPCGELVCPSSVEAYERIRCEGEAGRLMAYEARSSAIDTEPCETWRFNFSGQDGSLTKVTVDKSGGPVSREALDPNLKEAPCPTIDQPADFDALRQIARELPWSAEVRGNEMMLSHACTISGIPWPPTFRLFGEYDEYGPPNDTFAQFEEDGAGGYRLMRACDARTCEASNELCCDQYDFNDFD